MGKFKCILLIDDDEISNFLTERTIMINDLASRVEAAINGEEGLDKLKELYQTNGIPDLILLDIKMPVLDGFGFLKKFHALDIENKPQVVILSSSSHFRDQLRAKEYNIRGFIEKPLSVDKLSKYTSHDN